MSDKTQKCLIGVVILGLVACWVASGEIPGRYGSGSTESDNPFFWVMIVGMSGVGLWQLFSGMFGWRLFDSSDEFAIPDEPEPEAETDEGDSDGIW